MPIASREILKRFSTSSLKKMRLIAICCFPISLAAALALTFWVGSRPVDVGLDLNPGSRAVPVLQWGEGADQRVAMSRIPESFAPKGMVVELVCAGEKNPESKGREIGVRFPGSEKKEIRQDPPGSWATSYDPAAVDGGTKRVKKRHYVVDSPTTSTIMWTNFHGYGKIRLHFHEGAGIVRIRSANFDRTVDLYRKTDVWKEYEIPQIRLARYYGKVPRRALAGLNLNLGRGGKATIQRLYVGTVIPLIRFGGRDYPSSAWGRIVKDWKPQAKGGVFPVPSSRLERGGAVTFLFLVPLLWLFFCGAAFVAWGAVKAVRSSWERGPDAIPLTPFRFRTFCLFLIPILVVWGFYLCCFFPGTMSNDSRSQWFQAHRMSFSSLHPVLHTLTIRAVTLLWDSPAALPVLQILVLGCGLAYGFSLLLRAGVRPGPVVAVYLAGLFSMKNGLMSVVLWKDVLYSGLVLILTVFLFRIHCARPSERTGSAARWFFIALVLALLPHYRHNGLAILVGLFVLLPFFYSSQRKRAFCFGALGVLLFFLIQFSLFHLLTIEKFQAFQGYALTIRLAALVDQDTPFSSDEYEYLSKVRALDDRWSYSSVSTYQTMHSSKLNIEFLNENTDEFRSFALGLHARYPGIALRAWLERTRYLYWPFGEPIDTVMITTRKALSGRRKAAMSSRQIRKYHSMPADNSLLPSCRAFIVRLHGATTRDAFAWLFWRPALHLYAALLACAFLLVRRRDFRLAIVFLPVLLNTSGIFLAALGQEMRFQFPLTLTAGFLVCLAFLPRKETGEENPFP